MAVAVTFCTICFRFAHEFINIDCHDIQLNPVMITCIFITLHPTPLPHSPPPLPSPSLLSHSRLRIC